MKYNRFPYMNRVLLREHSIVFFDYIMQSLCTLSLTSGDITILAENEGIKAQTSNIFADGSSIYIMACDGKTALVYDGKPKLHVLHANCKNVSGMYCWNSKSDGVLIGLPENPESEILLFYCDNRKFVSAGNSPSKMFGRDQAYRIQHVATGSFMGPIVDTNKYFVYDNNDELYIDTVQGVSCINVVSRIDSEVWIIADENNRLIGDITGKRRVIATIGEYGNILRMVDLKDNVVFLPKTGHIVYILEKKSERVSKYILPEYNTYSLENHVDYTPMADCIEEDDYIYFLPWDYPFLLKFDKECRCFDRIECKDAPVKVIPRDIISESIMEESVYFGIAEMVNYICK